MQVIEPISPNDIPDAKAQAFPAFVIEAVNALVAAKFTAGSARFTQDDIINKILEGAPRDATINRHDVFDKGWLNFEEIYRAKGWKVNYDRPAYYEDYDANFTFSVK